MSISSFPPLVKSKDADSYPLPLMNFNGHGISNGLNAEYKAQKAKYEARQRKLSPEKRHPFLHDCERKNVEAEVVHPFCAERRGELDLQIGKFVRLLRQGESENTGCWYEGQMINSNGRLLGFPGTFPAEVVMVLDTPRSRRRRSREEKWLTMSKAVTAALYTASSDMWREITTCNLQRVWNMFMLDDHTRCSLLTVPKFKHAVNKLGWNLKPEVLDVICDAMKRKATIRNDNLRYKTETLNISMKKANAVPDASLQKLPNALKRSATPRERKPKKIRESHLKGPGGLLAALGKGPKAESVTSAARVSSFCVDYSDFIEIIREIQSTARKGKQGERPSLRFFLASVSKEAKRIGKNQSKRSKMKAVTVGDQAIALATKASQARREERRIKQKKIGKPGYRKDAKTLQDEADAKKRELRMKAFTLEPSERMNVEQMCVWYPDFQVRDIVNCVRSTNGSLDLACAALELREFPAASKVLTTSEGIKNSMKKSKEEAIKRVRETRARNTRLEKHQINRKKRRELSRHLLWKAMGKNPTKNTFSSAVINVLRSHPPFDPDKMKERRTIYLNEKLLKEQSKSAELTEEEKLRKRKERVNKLAKRARARHQAREDHFKNMKFPSSDKNATKKKVKKKRKKVKKAILEETAEIEMDAKNDVTNQEREENASQVLQENETFFEGDIVYMKKPGSGGRLKSVSKTEETETKVPENAKKVDKFYPDDIVYVDLQSARSSRSAGQNEKERKQNISQKVTNSLVKSPLNSYRLQSKMHAAGGGTTKSVIFDQNEYLRQRSDVEKNGVKNKKKDMCLKTFLEKCNLEHFEEPFRRILSVETLADLDSLNEQDFALVGLKKRSRMRLMKTLAS
eukprot:g4947.t1